jgi:hypothetical protein
MSAPPDRSSTEKPLVAAGFWIALALFGAIKLGTNPITHSSFYIYRLGAEAWLEGGTPYKPKPYPPEAKQAEPPLFRYSPPFAVAVVPFSIGHVGWSAAVWNAASVLLLGYGVARFLRVALPDATTLEFLAATLVAVGGAVRPTLSGNAHVASAACMLLATAALAEGRLWRAAAWAPFAVAAKAAPLVFAGLLALFRPLAFGARLAVALGLAAATPILVAGVDGCRAVYASWFEHLGSSHADRWPSFRDLWNIWELAGGFDLARYRVVQAVLGLATAAAVLVLVRRPGPLAPRVVAGAGLAQAYLLLCGPAVEFTQFVVIAPWLAVAAVSSYKRRKDFGLALTAAVTALALGNSPVEKLFVKALGTPWPEAFSTAGIALYVVWSLRNLPPAEPADGAGRGVPA